ncbi:MFS transporter [Pseudonocardia adelaidensis]|uniref:MFS transporter n=1 Tax=Pseudonocardia adelaidensis TaxID=648754 RepID=A0ABP9NM29_9PSEU
MVGTSAPAGIAGAPFRFMLGATVLCFSGYALLLPVVPLWAERGGSGAFGSGATTAVLMATTVATQLAVPWLLVRIGHRWVLAAGSVLLGAPTPFLALSADLAPVLALSALRGVGFGLATVAGSALVAELVPREQHGRAAGRYGLAVGVPQLVLLAAGVAVVDRFGFTAVFVVAGAGPVLGALLVPGIRMSGATVPTTAGPPPRPPVRSALTPVLAMLTCSISQGGLITFLPLAVPDAGLLVPGALLGTAAGSLLGRLVAGELVDRRGWGGRLLVPGMLLTAAGLMAEVVSLGAGAGALVVIGAVAVGFGFGMVQNDSLTVLFAAFGSGGYGAASAVWNIAYDAGTGVGALGLGAVAEPFGYSAAFGAAAVLLGVGVVVARARPGAATGRP